MTTTKRALVIFAPDAISNLKLGIYPRYFNPAGAMVQIATSLNEEGYSVDSIGITDCGFEVHNDYDLLIAHAGPAYSKYGELVGKSCRVLDYSTGCHWKAFNAQTAQRYENFAARRGIKPTATWMRPVIAEHEDYAAKRADMIVCLGPETARTFAPFSPRVVHVNNSAYVKPIAGKRPLQASATRSFLYQGGTGNIQKGLDLLIEAFAAEPDLHLYIDSPIEFEVLRHYKKELSAFNIHYSEWRTKIPGGMRAILEKCAFVLHAGMNSGQSTALVGALYHGLVPVVTSEANLGLDDLEVRIDSPSIPSIRKAIRHASQMQLPEVLAMSQATTKAYATSFSPNAFKAGFRTAISEISA